MDILAVFVDMFLIFWLFIEAQSTIVPDLSWNLMYYAGDRTYETNNETINIGTLLPGTNGQIDNSANSYIAYFNGSNSGIIIDNLTGTCITNLLLCDQGFTMAFWIKWHEYRASYIISSTFINIRHFTNDVLPIEVWNGEKAWRFFHQRNLTKDGWQYYSLTWSLSSGMFVYVDGIVTDKDAETKDIPISQTPGVVDGRLAFGTTADNNRPDSTPVISMSHFSLWNRALTKQEVIQLYQQEVNSMIPKANIVANASVSMTSLEDDKDHVLSNHAIKSIKVGSVMECYERCLEYRPDCKSYNYEYETESRTGKTCILNNERKENSPIFHFEEKKNFIYYELIS